MKELADIVAAANASAALGQPTALATIVGVDGSAFRRPGARMLIGLSGPLAGCISGGCLEADVSERAIEVIRSERPVMKEYDTSADDEGVFGLGMGCNGIISVFLEPVTTVLLSQLEEAVCILKSRSGCALATSYREGADRRGTFLVRDIGRLRDLEKLGEFVQELEPAVMLLVFGAGPVSTPLIRFGNELGWHTVIVDHRQSFVDRATDAKEAICGRPETLIDRVAFDRGTAVVVMTHNYQLDYDLLKLAASSSAFYVGLLGARRRTSRLLSDLEECSGAGGLANRLHTPVGLDIGAQTPEQIALAIAAEILASANPKSHVSLT